MTSKVEAFLIQHHLSIAPFSFIGRPSPEYTALNADYLAFLEVLQDFNMLNLKTAKVYGLITSSVRGSVTNINYFKEVKDAVTLLFTNEIFDETLLEFIIKLPHYHPELNLKEMVHVSIELQNQGLLLPPLIEVIVNDRHLCQLLIQLNKMLRYCHALQSSTIEAAQACAKQCKQHDRTLTLPPDLPHHHSVTLTHVILALQSIPGAATTVEFITFILNNPQSATEIPALMQACSENIDNFNGDYTTCITVAGLQNLELIPSIEAKIVISPLIFADLMRLNAKYFLIARKIIEALRAQEIFSEPNVHALLGEENWEKMSLLSLVIIKLREIGFLNNERFLQLLSFPAERLTQFRAILVCSPSFTWTDSIIDEHMSSPDLMKSKSTLVEVIKNQSLSAHKQDLLQHVLPFSHTQTQFLIEHSHHLFKAVKMWTTLMPERSLLNPNKLPANLLENIIRDLPSSDHFEPAIHIISMIEAIFKSKIAPLYAMQLFTNVNFSNESHYHRVILVVVPYLAMHINFPPQTKYDPQQTARVHFECLLELISNPLKTQFVHDEILLPYQTNGDELALDTAITLLTANMAYLQTNLKALKTPPAVIKRANLIDEMIRNFDRPDLTAHFEALREKADDTDYPLGQAKTLLEWFQGCPFNETQFKTFLSYLLTPEGLMTIAALKEDRECQTKTLPPTPEKTLALLAIDRNTVTTWASCFDTYLRDNHFATDDQLKWEEINALVTFTSTQGHRYRSADEIILAHVIAFAHKDHQHRNLISYLKKINRSITNLGGLYHHLTSAETNSFKQLKAFYQMAPVAFKTTHTWDLFEVLEKLFEPSQYDVTVLQHLLHDSDKISHLMDMIHALHHLKATQYQNHPHLTNGFWHDLTQSFLTKAAQLSQNELYTLGTNLLSSSSSPTPIETLVIEAIEKQLAQAERWTMVACPANI